MICIYNVVIDTVRTAHNPHSIVMRTV